MVKHYIKDEDIKSLINQVRDKVEKEKQNGLKKYWEIAHDIENEFKFEMMEEVGFAKFDSKLKNLIIKKDGKTIYEFIKNENSKYDLDTLIKAVVLTEDTVNIYNAAIFAKNITKEQFLMCASAIVDSKDADGIVYFYIHCNKNNGSFNSFNVSNEVIEMIKETNDQEFIKSIIKNIKNREDTSRRYRRIDIPYGEGLFEGMTYLRYCLENNIKKAGV